MTDAATGAAGHKTSSVVGSSWFLVDNNVLSKLSRKQRGSRFFRHHCRLPSEVLHEASAFPDIRALRRLEYPVTPTVLEHVRDVLATVPPGDFSLVDLYRNMGNADPILIATALDAMAQNAQALFEEVWHIVTDDAAVRRKAIEFQLSVLGHADFQKLLALDAHA